MGWLGTSMGAMTRAATGLLTGLPTSGPGYALLSGILQGQGGAPPRRGTREFLDAYSRMPLLRAIVQRISFSVASTPWQLFVVQGGNGRARNDGVVKQLQRNHDPVSRQKALTLHRQGKELREISPHPFLETMDTGNPYQTGLQMRMVLSGSMELVGEAFWVKERDYEGVVRGVWPIPAYWVTGTPTPSSPHYRVSFRGWTGTIPDTEMLWFQDPDPANPYWRGTGVAASVSDELETDEYAAKTTKMHFINRAKPDILITSPDLQKEEVQRLQLEWQSQHGGFWNALKPRFMNRAVDVHEFDTDFRAGQFVQIRQHERDIVQQTWGVPPEILGIVENSNRATIQAAEYLYSKLVIVPRLELIRSIFQERFIQEWDERLIVDYVSPVEKDREFNLRAAASSPWAITLDEWRELQGKDELDGGRGKIYFLPSGQFVREHPIADPVAEAAQAREDKLAMQAAALAAGTPLPGTPGVPPAVGNGTPGQPWAAPPPRGTPTPFPRARTPEPPGPSVSDWSPGQAQHPQGSYVRTVRVREKASGRTGTLTLGADAAVPPHLEVVDATRHEVTP